MIEEIFMRILGWCPGTEAVAEFNQRRGTEKFTGFIALLGIWLMSYWWFTETALGLYGTERILYVNRTNFLLLLGGIVVVGYAWKQFKPSDWELPEFNYKKLSIDDLPDIPIDAEYTWLSGPSNPSTGPGTRAAGRGFEKAGTLRNTDIEWYREKIEYYRNLRDELLRKEGKPVPKRPSNKTPIIRVLLLLILVSGSAFTYSYLVLHPQQLALEAYTFERLSGFEIVVLKSYDDSVRINTSIMELYDFDEFVSMAREQGAETIYYRVERGPSNYFVFVSPVYDEAYRIYLRDIDR